MSHNEPYRLKANSREAIEQAIPFALYREYEDGNEYPVFATENYSYHFIGKEVLEEAEYDGDEMIKAPVLSDYVLANVQDYRDEAEEIDFGSEVELLTNVKTPIHGWT